MKREEQFKKWMLPASALTGVVLLSASVSKTKPEGDYIAHEWGTFTSVQGGDGQLLQWRPLQSSHLPGFVYDWQRPGMGRIGTAQLAYGKGAMITLQRMETPVIYFYADREQTVDVTVKFPQGLLTEWYPQATRIGPSVAKPSTLVTEMDTLVHKVGIGSSFTFASWFSNHALKDSGATWSHIRVLPQKPADAGAPALPQDQSGSHYFAARETDANCLRVDSPAATNRAPECEKFIFYRGVGNFPTPLRATMEADGSMTLETIGTDPIKHLFVLSVERGKAQFLAVQRLAPGAKSQAQTGSSGGALSLAQVSAALSAQMAESLTEEGLYRREAEAMVNTWRDSWFEEDGVRVLYILPRKWTDQTLPLAINPPPRALVRVMVGRAEVLTPAMENHLTDELRKSQQGDSEARDQATAELRRLGRFADPAMQLATSGTSSGFRQQAWSLFQLASQPVQKAF